jgi:hypothetical protein
MAVGLRHNHDISIILTKTKGLAMLFYITNYATKLDTPMWKRLVFAADVLIGGGGRDLVSLAETD